MGGTPEVQNAVISDDEKYRYVLVRQWDTSRPLVVFLMLNPSTADGSQDDATTRSCRAIAQNSGFGGMLFVNLYAYRAKNPSTLYMVQDPIGPDNDKSLRWVCARAEKIIVAWGNRGPSVVANQILHVMNVLSSYWDVMYSLGTTNQGQPTHPRFIAPDVELIPFDVREYLVSERAVLEDTSV